MPAHFNVQASGIMVQMLDDKSWAVAFAVYVTDETGLPVKNLADSDFRVWDVTNHVETSIKLVTDFGKEILAPKSRIAGLYRVQTDIQLMSTAPAPQQRLFAVGVVKVMPTGGGLQPATDKSDTDKPGIGKPRVPKPTKSTIVDTTIEGVATVAVTFLGASKGLSG